MNTDTWLKRLHRQMDSGSRHTQLIRFRKRKDFEQCMARLKQLKARWPRFRAIEAFPFICTLRCSLRTTSGLHGPRLLFEPDWRLSLHAYSPFQESHKETKTVPPRIPWGVRQIGAHKLWKTTKGEGIRIGVIDTGTDASHPDLKGRVVGGVNVLHPYAPPADDNGHGTHIAGTIAACGGSHGMTGVAPAASLYAVKSFDRHGSAYLSDIVKGIEWCVHNEMDIINMSFGMTDSSPTLREAVKQAVRSGIIVCASSGNDGKTGIIDYPAQYKDTIAVGATEKGRYIAAFSNRGERIDIYAPGDRIVSTWPKGRYETLSGTSMATSHVTGLIALLMACKRKGVRPTTIRRLLRQTARAVRSRSEGRTGDGEIDGPAAYLSLLAHLGKSAQRSKRRSRLRERKQARPKTGLTGSKAAVSARMGITSVLERKHRRDAGRFAVQSARPLTTRIARVSKSRPR
ncbi:peptidase S8 [Xylanibacillus composti]|uniref:Aerolysin n=1 Tax=Xylanibacillus composti TaxID=1572762 RepID=A0A8J4M2L6_9BACL|nr:S8 family peptidase [Xylanibacillus composti]MDT9725022.1 peptidase S8 [Xylanibacillus composti]GIQ69814.1 aerolysin [Xylanibacillus composti]